ncbi:MAG: hypothetical protein GF331_24740, partial [Chitinivibrionales bacterium]|nr:hypothetical protein [Chitinivibrionales bacterium]
MALFLYMLRETISKSKHVVEHLCRAPTWTRHHEPISPGKRSPMRSISKHHLTTIVLAVAALMAVSCSDPGPDQAAPTDPVDQQVTLLRSSVARDTTPQVAQDVLAELTSGNTAFAFDLYEQLRRTDGNLFYSPYSISLALAMLYGGARGDTEAEIADALHFTLSQQLLHPAFNHLDLTLTSRGEGAQGQDGEPFRLRIANSVWGQTGYSFEQDYLDLLARNYGAGMNLLDFASDPESARTTINNWVSDSTEGRIDNLLPPGSIVPLTRMVLTNAIYFNAAWEYQFEESATESGEFTTVDGIRLTVPFMRQTEHFGYKRGDAYEVIELPYDGNELSMVIIAPDSGDFSWSEKGMNAATITAAIDSLNTRRVDLSMPK